MNHRRIIDRLTPRHNAIVRPHPFQNLFHKNKNNPNTLNTSALQILAQFINRNNRNELQQPDTMAVGLRLLWGSL
jgi:hypothetical protein